MALETASVAGDRSAADKPTAPASIGPDRSRLIQLDVLRGVAIVLVLFTHNLVEPEESGFLRPVLTYLRYLGPSGVDLFFVLSGFLIGGLLFRELHDTGRLDVRRFLIRRAFRIWPPYFAFVAFIFLWLVLLEHATMADAFLKLVPNLLHVQNYLGSPRQHTWSLAVEEHFYLVLPFLLLLLTRRRPKETTAIPAVPYIAIGVFILCAILRAFAYASPQPYNPHFATHLRMDSLFFGVMLAYLHQFEPHKLQLAATHRGLLVCLGMALLLAYPALVIGRYPVVGVLGFPMLYVGYGCLLLVMVYAQPGTGWLGMFLASPVARAMAFVGYFSYPMYLWHIDASLFVTRMLRALAGLPPEIRWLCVFALYVLVALAVAVVFALVLDKPSLALRDRLFPAKAEGMKASDAHAAPSTEQTG